MTKISKPSLAETHPELAAQADGWDPQTIIAGSKRKLRWLCDLGHEWEAIVSNRSNLKSGCPFCSGNKIMIGFNDLATTHPEIASQAVGWDPKTVSRGSHKKCLWRCELGHEWKAIISDRTGRTPKGCGVCAGKQVLIGVTDLATTHPEIASQAVGWDPKTVSAGSNRKHLWRCEFGHQWAAQIKGRVRGYGCAVCDGKKVMVGFNDLATTHPDLALQSAGWDPKKVSRGSGKNLLWRCELGHEWKATVGNRARGEGCPICSRHRTLAGFNDLATTHPELALQAVGWDPKTVSAGSNRKHRWRCEFGHEWKAIVASRALNKRACPYCAGKQVMVGFNDLATTHPDLASQAVGWDPKTVSRGSGKNLLWRCELGHEWKAMVNSRSGRDKGRCPTCSGRRILAGFNDFATTHPDLALQAVGWDPKTVRAGSNRKHLWRCELGHEWKATVGNRANLESGCPYCVGKQVMIGFNDLATTHPDLALQADGWNPKEISFGSARKKKWKCDQGHSFFQAVANRAGKQKQGCPSCANSGFDPNQPSFLYFIYHFDLQMLQIGITNDPERRLFEHRKIGWEPLELRGPMDGHLTRKLETDCLHALEKRGAILGHKAGIEKFDGYTEAWTKASLNVMSIKQILDWVYEDEAK